PYITASIVRQLIQMDIVPNFAEWARLGEVGRRKLAQFSSDFTIVLADVHAIGMSFAFNQICGGALIDNDNIGSYLLIDLILTTGTAFLLWMGELITSHGVGNGISIIIFAGILGSLPSALIQLFQSRFTGNADTTMAVLQIAGLV